MNGLIAVYRRELAAYFETPLAWVFLTVFAFAAPSFAWRLGRLFDTARADLAPFFDYLPWLLLLLMPALAMRTWAEERDRGTLEGLLSSPISIRQAALGKFLAAWSVAALALIATFPMWIAMNVLGAPDNAAIATAYFGALLLAGGYLAIGQALSALTHNQVVAFVLGVVSCFLITIAGLPFVFDALAQSIPGALAEALAELSALARFEALRRGVITLSDVVYFISLIGVGLCLAIVFVDDQRRHVRGGWRFVAAMSTGLVLIVSGVNLVAATHLTGARVDLTERQLYRLSPGTRDVLNRLEEPVLLGFYYSRADAAHYPAVRAYGARVRELLRTISAQSGGQVLLREIDPAPFSTEEDAAISAGLQTLPTEDGGQIFFGLIGQNALDARETIAFFDPLRETRLEFEIARLIAALERPRKPSLAILTSLSLGPGLDGDGLNPIVSDLQAQFDLNWLDRDFDALPENTDALMIIHPPELSSGQTYLIDQFALETGRVLLAVDPMAHFALKPDSDGLPPIDALRASSLANLMAQWGVAYDPNTVVMDGQNGLPVQIMEGGRTRTRAYPLWFVVPEDAISENLPAVSGLTRGVNLGSPGVLETEPVVGLQHTVLLQTSEIAARIDADIAASSPTPESLMRDHDPASDAPLTLAVSISGMLSTAFSEGPPTDLPGLDPDTHQTQSRIPAEIVVISDVDLFDPAFYLSADPVTGTQILADNIDLISNLTDWLAGDRALISLRARDGSNRPMTRVDALRSAAEARYLDVQDQVQAQLNDAEAELQTLTRQGRASSLGGASSADSERAEALRQSILDARARLRDIERGFRIDIDALENQLQLATVWAPPIGIIVIGLGFTLWRRRYPA